MLTINFKGIFPSEMVLFLSRYVSSLFFWLGIMIRTSGELFKNGTEHFGPIKYCKILE
jgi:hypothetical protein